MGYAVELTFDEASGERISVLSALIHTQCGGTDLTGVGAQPHISLAVFDTQPPVGIEPLLAHFAAGMSAFSVHFAAVGTFPGPQGVVYLAPVVTNELLTLHKRFHAQLDAVNLAGHGYYRPGVWVPHCTVGYGLAAEQLPVAVALCRQADIFASVTVCALRLIEFRPVQVLCEYQLLDVSPKG